MSRVQIPVGLLEFEEGGDTIWIQGATGGTTMRIKLRNLVWERANHIAWRQRLNSPPYEGRG